MYYTYFQGIKPLGETPFAKHHFVGDMLTYLFPTDENLTLVAVSMPISEFAIFKKEPLRTIWSGLSTSLVGDAQQVMDPWSGMGIDHTATHADLLADSLHHFLCDETTWDAAMTCCHTHARKWREKTFRRTSTHAVDLRPMTRIPLQKRGLA